MQDTFELKCGITLQLQPVSADAIRNLIADSDMEPIVSQWETLTDAGATKRLEQSLDTQTMLDINRGTTRLFNYCIGFGVVHTPPQDELKELHSMGFDTSTPRIALVNWLRYLKLDGTDEAGELVGTIMTLSVQAVRQDEPTEADLLRARIAELESRENDGSRGTRA